MIKIWGRANSINVMKVLWCLDELGVGYEREDAGMQFGVVDEPRYRAINPNGRVPTLVDGDFVLWESNVIVRYLCASHAAGSLWPVDAKARAHAEMWMDWQQTTLHPDMTAVFWQMVRTPEAERDMSRVGAAAERLGTLWGHVDQRLGHSPWLGGDEFTMADIPLGAMVSRWSRLDIARPALPRLQAWYARLRERPGYRHVELPLS